MVSKSSKGVNNEMYCYPDELCFTFILRPAGKHTHIHTRTSAHTLTVKGQCPGLTFLSITAECTSRFSWLCTPRRSAGSQYLNQVLSRFLSPKHLSAQVSTPQHAYLLPL